MLELLGTFDRRPEPKRLSEKRDAVLISEFEQLASRTLDNKENVDQVNMFWDQKQGGKRERSSLGSNKPSFHRTQDVNKLKKSALVDELT